MVLEGCTERFGCSDGFEATAPIFFCFAEAASLGPTAPMFMVTPGELLTSAKEVVAFPEMGTAMLLFGELALNSLIFVLSGLTSPPTGDCDFR